jgi:hypothetical protein
MRTRLLAAGGVVVFGLGLALLAISVISAAMTVSPAARSA